MFSIIIVLSTLMINGIRSQTELSLPPLPYPANALEPVLSEHLMNLHHGKHHRVYTDKVNVALKAMHTDQKLSSHLKLLANQSIEVILTELQIIPGEYRLILRNNGGGYINHKLFFSMLRAPTATAAENKPKDELLKVITETFGSFEKFQETFTNTSLNLFGSGWVWLYIDAESQRLTINFTANQDNPIMLNKHHVVILGLDLWEHAYYPVYENRRNEYVANFWRIVNWSVVAQLYTNGIREHSDL